MKKNLLMALMVLSLIISGCDNQSKQREIEKQRQEDSIRVAENVKKELAEQEAAKRAEREKQEAEERAERERQEAEKKERIERDAFYSSAGGPFSITKVIKLAYQAGVSDGGLSKKFNEPHFAGGGTEKNFKNWWVNSLGIPDNEKANDVYNQAQQEYLRGYNDGINF